MNQEVKKKWLEALRSGNYKQGKNRLKFNDNYCCLGVLCDLYSKEHEGVNFEKNTFIDGIYSFMSSTTYIDNDVRMWAGLELGNPIVKHNGIETTLVELNDAINNCTFNEIADLIEEQL